MIMRPPQQGHGGRWSAAVVAPCRRIDHWGRPGDQFSDARNIGFACGAGEQPVVADAVEAFGQDVDQEAADERVGRQRHRAKPLPANTSQIINQLHLFAY
jgi:hypothetical protein